MVNTNALSQKYLSSSASAVTLKAANKIIEIRNFTVDRFFLKKIEAKKVSTITSSSTNKVLLSSRRSLFIGLFPSKARIFYRFPYNFFLKL